MEIDPVMTPWQQKLAREREEIKRETCMGDKLANCDLNARKNARGKGNYGRFRAMILDFENSPEITRQWIATNQSAAVKIRDALQKAAWREGVKIKFVLDGNRVKGIKKSP